MCPSNPAASRSRGFQIRLLLCDLDGTLTGPTGRGHSVRLVPLLNDLMARGTKIGVVSGREMVTALAVHRLFDLNGPIIGENGAEAILDPQHDEANRVNLGGLAPPQLDHIREQLQAHGLLARMFIDREKRYMLTLYPNEFPKHRPEELPQLREAVADALRSFGNSIEITYSSAAVDVSAHGVDKGSGIQKTCELLNLPLAAVAFVGDSANDRSAFTVVGRGGGWLAYVGRDATLERELQEFSKVYYARESASEGTAEFMQFVLTQERDHAGH